LTRSPPNDWQLGQAKEQQKLLLDTFLLLSLLLLIVVVAAGEGLQLVDFSPAGSFFITLYLTSLFLIVGTPGVQTQF
jgi:hypothetical protein